MNQHDRAPRRAVLDTNVFVAAGFAPRHASALLLSEIAAGRLVQLWCPATRAETERVLRRIPPLDWSAAAPLFAEDGRVGTDLDLEAVAFVADPSDRKFAALSRATCAPLVTADDHLLAHRGRLNVWTPRAFLDALRGGEHGEA